MIVARHKEGLPPFVETLRRWQRDGGPSRLERVMMSKWFNYAVAGTGLLVCGSNNAPAVCAHIRQLAPIDRLVRRVVNHD